MAALLEHYERWVTVPRVRYLTLWDTTAYYLRAFAQRVWPPGWIGLQFVEEPKPWLHEWPHDPASGIAAVVRSPQAAQLRELRFSGWGLGDGGVQALCESPYLAELAVLGVDQSHFSDARLVERFGAKLRQGYW